MGKKGNEKTKIHPTASIGVHVQIGCGVVVGSRAVVESGVVIGRGAFISRRSAILDSTITPHPMTTPISAGKKKGQT